MNDRTKTRLSLTFFISAFLLPLAGLLAGWLAIDFQTGLLIGGITFGVFFLTAGIFMASIKTPTWFTVWLPYLLSILYAIVPDFLVGPLDDTAAVLFGSILTFILWIKKQPEAPRWIAAPLIGTTAYILVGGFIPGPFDELIVTLLMGGIAAAGGVVGWRRKKQAETGAEKAAEPVDILLPAEPLEDGEALVDEKALPSPEIRAEEDFPGDPSDTTP